MPHVGWLGHIITIKVKLRVQRQDGKIETLDIFQPISMLEGIHMDRIVGSDGTEYFFTKEGYYDGWGKAAPESKESQGEKQS